MAGPRRVVVTGLGLVTPLGIGVSESWEALVSGRSGIGPVTRCDTSNTRVQIAGEVKGFDSVARFGTKGAKRMELFSQYAVAAAEEALADAGLSGLPCPSERMAVALGVGMGGLPTLEYATRWFYGQTEGRISPYFIPMVIPNMAAANLALRFGAQGPTLAPAAACASGAQAIGEAWRMLRSGEADAALAGGAEAALTSVALLGFATMRALSTRNEEPLRASRPFDRDRDGFVMAEGAGVVLLETLEAAQARGATIHAELLGYAARADAYHLTASTPDGSGPARCMLAAVSAAGLSPADLGYVNAHATATPDGDRAEVEGIKLAFGDHAPRLALSSTKGATGHCLGGAGAIETVFTALSLERGVLPATLNLESLGDPSDDPTRVVCDPRLDYVRGEARPARVRYALNNSFGFGGVNVSLVLGQAPQA